MKPRSPSTDGKGKFPHTDYFFHSGFDQWRGGYFSPYAGDVFGHDARDEEVQQIIFATGFSAAAAHLESAEGMTADDCTGARTVDVNIAGFQLRLDTLDVGGTAREKAARQRIISAVGDFDRFIEVAYF